jgi:hypothetical protein
VNPPLAESPPLAAPPRARDRKGGLSFGIVAAVFLGLLAVGFTVALVIHRRYVGFERVAARHIPADTSLAMRWDVEKVALFEPTRRFLLPLFDATRGEAPSGETRRERLSRAAGLEIGRDLREAVVLFGPAPGDWAVVLAGSFPTGDLLKPLLGALEHEGARSGGPNRITTPGGLIVSRAADGAFVLAGNASRLDATLVSRDPPPAVPRIGAGALVLHPNRPGLPAGAAEVLAPLGDVTEVVGQAEWGNPLRVELTLQFRHEPPPDIGERVRRSLALLWGPEAARLEQRFGPPQLQSAGNQAVRVRLALDDVALQHAADRAARAVVSGLALRPVLD